MIENAALLKSAAGQIDALDAEIRALQDDKKAVFDNIKESVEPPTFKAWKEAVKLRQKRRVDKDALEAHDSRVWAVLAMLEATGTEDAVNTSRAPAGAEPDRLETLIAEAEAFLPPHDPETGEIHDHAETVTTSPRADGETLEPGSPSTIPISSAHCLPDDSDEGANLRSAAGEQVSSVPPRPLAGSIDMGDIPPALDRRKRIEAAA
jgi:uncharacterized protein (UPF0335 family)